MIKKIVAISCFFLFLIGSANPQELRGTWLARNTLASKESLAKAMDTIAANNFNTVYVNLWSRGYPLWKSDVFFAETGVYIDPTFQGRDILAEAIAEGHKRGLHIEAWFEYGFVGGWSGNQPPGGKGPIFNAHPDWVAKKIDGGEIDNSNFYWMVHTMPDVQNFLIAMCTEIARNYDVDGIELDRIRYSSLQYGYDAYTDSLYRAQNNGNPPPQNYSDTSWIRWRANNLNQFMVRMKDSLKAINPHLNISNAPSLYSASGYTAYNDYCQDWIGWLHDGSVDNIQVQSYVGSSNSFGAILDYIIQLVPDRTKVYPAFAIYPGGVQLSETEIKNFVTVTRNKGFKGNAIWYFTDLAGVFPFIKQNVFTSPNYPAHSQANWREFYKIVEISNTSNAVRTGNWQQSTVFGYNGASFYADNSAPATVDYYFEVPADGYYEVYTYNVTAVNRTDSAHISVFDSSENSSIYYVNQSDANLRRWVKLGDHYLKAGRRNVVTISNDGLKNGKFLSADAMMIVLNRRLSPSVTGVGKEENEGVKKKSIKTFNLKSYPNPFNGEFKLTYTIPAEGTTEIKVFNTAGELVRKYDKTENEPGSYEINITANGLASGVYFVSIGQAGYYETIKIILNK
ncbi:MAG: family 10 glycosylhydrolase [Ignavibacteriales bacterium]|nr:MAG: family 10 glycosylhydrolase [Ignavibacteriaceae bacterium]MBW7872375.1 family 10 glycosylhydrolase [Ignavibacteria bacterium]MCZ2142658.1 family 10 glycosylhydrolase [Ignavibacteriales bacterium]OQY76063.1 MAG: hypothetical protein B6D45_04635 [Ignavibacteriales bacterium UTCHB3]MBV6445479.1 hypothetical protein [Ignavibacteriaceae bacterium]